MPSVRSPRYLLITATLLLAGLAACDVFLDPETTPLTGLQHVASQDSAGNNPPPMPPGTPGPGYFQGTVLGPSEPGGGPDTLATAPRVAGAVLAAYALPPNGTIDSNVLGDAVQTV